MVPKQVEHRCRQRCRRRRRARSEDRGHLLTETLIGRSGSRLTTVAGKEATMTVAGVTRLHARRLEVGRGGTRSPLGLLDVAPVLGRSTGTGRLAGKSPPSSRPEKTQMELAWAGPWVGLPLPVISPALAADTPAKMRAAAAGSRESHLRARGCGEPPALQRWLLDGDSPQPSSSSTSSSASPCGTPTPTSSRG